MKTFGDVIKIEGKDYVFLAAIDDILYLALIPNRDLSQELIRRRDRVFTVGSKDMQAKQQQIAWCFVELKTEDLKERIALYGYPGQNLKPEDLIDRISTLCKEDKELLKKEIVRDSAISKGLVKIIKDTQIE